MDNLADILSRKDYDVPQEVTIIKRYVQEHFKVGVGVSVQVKTITITARSAPLVGCVCTRCSFSVPVKPTKNLYFVLANEY
jgi:hypothetical protein